MVEWKAHLKKEVIYYRLESFGQQVWQIRSQLIWSDVAWGIGIAVFFAFFFYRSPWAGAPMIPVGGLFVFWRQKKRKRNRERQLLIQFKECVLSVAGSLKAGYAVENAFQESISDMQVMFGENCEMVEELQVICNGLHNNKTLEELLRGLAQRSGLEEVLEFAEVFGIAKRNSGNITETIDIYSKIIAGKLELEAEIETLLAAKRLEQKVMNGMPFLIVLYLEYSNPGYFDMMYHNLFGVAIMTVCLGVYLCAYALSEKIFQKAFG